MATTTAENVIKMNANNDVVTTPMLVKAIKITEDASGVATVSLRANADAAGGTIIYTATLAADDELFEGPLPIRANRGLALNLTGSATVFLYLD